MLATRFRFRSIDPDLLRALRCIAALLVVTAIGTTGFVLIERDWGVWKALFFTLITITTVGYGDEGLSSNGEVFAAAVLLMGIGTATYTLSSLVQIAITYQTSWKRRMQQQINRMDRHFIICGFGRIGQTVAAKLKAADVPFIVVERSDDRVEAAVSDGFTVVQGNSTEDQVLLQAGIDRARGIICGTDSDAENVFVTLSARELNPKLFIAARASTESAACKVRRAGASVVVSPYVSAGVQITDAILGSPQGETRDIVVGGEMSLVDVEIGDDSLLAGNTVQQALREYLHVVAVELESINGTSHRRPSEQMLLPGDRLTIAGYRSQLQQVAELARGSTHEIPSSTGKLAGDFIDPHPVPRSGHPETHDQDASTLRT